jgi:hypothetical protein
VKRTPAKWRGRRARKVAGLEDVVRHDLRHSVASVAATSGGSLPLIGKLLGHNQAMTTARYAHLAGAPIKQLNERVGHSIAKAIGRQASSKAFDLASAVDRLEELRALLAGDRFDRRPDGRSAIV